MVYGEEDIHFLVVSINVRIRVRSVSKLQNTLNCKLSLWEKTLGNKKFLG